MSVLKFQGATGDQDLEVVDVDGLVFFSFCPILLKTKAFHHHKIKKKLTNLLAFKTIVYQKVHYERFSPCIIGKNVFVKSQKSFY